MHLWAALRQKNARLRVVYGGLPAAEGRPWALDAGDADTVAGSIRTELDAIRRCGRSDEVILSGGYIGGPALLRRALLPRRAARVHFWGERFEKDFRLDAYRSWYFGRLDSIFAVGSWAVPSYRTRVSPETPIHVLPYTTAERPNYRTLSDTPTIGFVGSLIRRKGLDTLLLAIGSMPARERPRVEVAGSGTLRPELEEMARSLGVTASWLGELGPEDLDAQRATWWALAVPSRYDGWGVVVSEAFAAGLPVIVSAQVGAGRDLVRHDYNGFVAVGSEGWVKALRAYRKPSTVYLHGRRAHVVGQEMSSKHAADWLLDVLSQNDVCERSFVEEAWERVRNREE